ncbi:hypothetical protein [Psychrobacillus psychrodurans]|uniref:hypothetical protein n=1 Tax=Psychrobacillus psychrodurans TaxID=126157 RepID=UPI003CFC3163
MKYKFITILHNMKLETIKNKGTEIFPGARISNGSRVLTETLETSLSRTTIGIHSIDEFKNTVYFYIEGEFKDIHTKEEMDKIGNEHTFLFLRQAQHFIHHLWEVKDNNIYVRDGFLFAYNQNFEEGFTYKASLSEIFTYSSCEQKESMFSNSEILSAICNFIPPTFEDYGVGSFGGKLTNSNHFYKSKGSNRMKRASYFAIGARNSSVLPMKIVSYCTALECLFTIGKSEVNHKIAERVAIMIGTSEESKKGIFKLIKEAYNYRSSLVHGQYLKGTEVELVTISQKLDDILRNLLVANHNIFSENDNVMEDFFLDLLFTQNTKI